MTITPLPCTPRALSPRELKRLDVYSYRSPKLGRDVHVANPVGIIAALQLEFDPAVVAFVERPRTLEVDSAPLEIDFWVRDRAGREHYWMLVSNGDAVDPTTPRRAHRRASAVREAADHAGICVRFGFEHELAQDHAAFRVRRLLLGSVQDAIRMPNRQSIQDEITDFFRVQTRANVDQVCGTLAGYRRCDIGNGIAELIHRGWLVLLDPRQFGRFSVVEWRSQHADA